MISRDKKLLLLGMLTGILVAGALMAVFFMRQQSAKAAIQGESQAVSSSPTQQNDITPIGTAPGCRRNQCRRRTAG
jgi:hypothetical protein